MAVGRKAARLKVTLLLLILLTGCGGRTLSRRAVVRALFFLHPGEVLLLLEDADAAEGEPEYRTVYATGETAAQALAAAEQSPELAGEVFYGLTDVVGLPPESDWQTATAIGELLYEQARPTPELSLFLLAGDEEAGNAGSVYESLQDLERNRHIHCGLQQLFTQDGCCLLPIRQQEGYGFALLADGAVPVRWRTQTAAQLAAVLCGESDRLDLSYADGHAHCRADADVTFLPAREQTTVQLHLTRAELEPLTATLTEAAARQALCAELQTAFADLCRQAASCHADPMRLALWSAVHYGPGTRPAAPRLVITFE